MAEADCALFAETLQRLMRAKGVSFREVSDHTGVAHSSLSKYGRGKAQPRTDTCIRLADYFDVCPNAVLVAAGHRPLKYLERDALDPDLARPEMVRLVEKLRQIPDPHRLEIVEVLGRVLDGCLLMYRANSKDDKS